MNNISRRVAILGGARIPFARANTAYAEASNQDMLTAALKSLVEKFSLKGQRVGEVAAGAVIKHSRDWNLARECTLGSGLHPETPAYDLQRACGTSLSAAAQLAHRIAAGEIDSAIAGGVDSASDIPLSYGRKLQRAVLKLNRAKTFGEPARHHRLGAVARPQADAAERRRAAHRPVDGAALRGDGEGMEDRPARADELAFASHQSAAAAWKSGFFKDLVYEFNGLKGDNNVRADTSLEKLSTLKTAFDRSPAATLTAGNSSPLTDGAACVLLASEEWASSRKIPVQAYLSFTETAAVDFVGMAGPKEGMLLAPAYAVPRMLDRARLKLQDFDIYEIHEAFAAQVLCTLKAWESEDFCRSKLNRPALGKIDRAKMNPVGSSVAIGHPFAATGARIVATLAKELAQARLGPRPDLDLRRRRPGRDAIMER
jgi:acetyl-CoA C-acetyltransferase